TPEGVVVQEDPFSGGYPAELIDPATGKARPLPGKLGEARQDVLLAVAPDGKAVVSLEGKGPAFRVWSWPAGALLKTVPLLPPEKRRSALCEACSFTPDGKQFVAVVHYSGPSEWQIKGPSADRPFVERWDLGAGKMLGRVDAKGLDHPVLVGPGG